MCKVYLLLGGNLDNRENNISLALNHLEKEIGNIIQKSSIFETKAWGLHEQPDFLNIAVIINTNLEPLELLKKTQKIENLLGRRREEKWGARTMDIDILFYDDRIIHTKELTLPHPLIAERMFVLIPLNEISPNLMHPVLYQTINQLLINCLDHLPVNKYLKSNIY
ncbi:hypothetical protein A5893_03310 [Pedobacter psychrophilus]|uniref:2-amino-4-hydroxy-6-hydroxymethyldihydropteridine pyrophosphokinase n=1 Tax=Pedobacter psychrophilus TaxID=1826909 RepID=A0A179DM77_9SPHI|nr:2-amino-4-hydroxy-6-hydroxymethyldihydropteridine diphosphokinase [Pedobacter psychrophilus]OAQ42157.1 hypothetical protein A5893_03310 [Pedobacter psychrophilus]